MYRVCTRKVLISTIHYIPTVVEICLHTKASVWSKTSLNTGGVGGAETDPFTCKMGTFFLRSLTLIEPIFNNFQINGAKMFSEMF